MGLKIIVGLIAFAIGFGTGASGNGTGFTGFVFGGALAAFAEIILFILSNS